MLPAERRMQIVDLVKGQGIIEVPELSRRFGVSEGTIRRDFRILEEKGLLERTYGGAFISKGTSYDPPFTVQKKAFVKEKEGIAQAAAKLIEEGDTIFLDSSSTNLHLARKLKTRKNLTIVTNGIEIGYELNSHGNKNVIVTGGELRFHTASLLGKLAERVITELYLDKAFLGVSAISLQRGMATGTIIEAELKKAAIAAAREVIAVTDSSKFGKEAFALVAGLEVLDVIITDPAIPSDYLEAISEKGIEVIIAE